MDLIAMANQDPKVALLRYKLALLVGHEFCPIYDVARWLYPNALQEPWSTTMTGPPKYVGTLVILSR